MTIVLPKNILSRWHLAATSNDFRTWMAISDLCASHWLSRAADDEPSDDVRLLSDVARERAKMILEDIPDD